jgi:hypothetical protein
MRQRLGRENEELGTGMGAREDDRGAAPFYRGEGAGRQLVKVAAQPTILNGARGWSLDGEGETVGWGGVRATTSFHFAT